jgi:hypothetical protein
MNKQYLWTASKARLQLVRSSDRGNLQWLFLPGGLGLGSEYLFPLLNILELPGDIRRLDLPGDGSNTTSDNRKSFSHWSQSIQMQSVLTTDIHLYFKHFQSMHTLISTVKIFWLTRTPHPSSQTKRFRSR